MVKNCVYKSERIARSVSLYPPGNLPFFHLKRKLVFDRVVTFIHPFAHLGSVELIAQLQQMQLDASKANNKTDLKTELKEIASDKGFRIVNNEGSGNCMFYALSDQLEIAMRIKIKHDELRQILVQYLRKNPKLVS